MYRETVRSDISNPSFRSSPWILGAPQVLFSSTICRIRVWTSLLILGLPVFFDWERNRQNRRKPARCQETTVSGLTMIRAFVHAGQSRRSRIPKSLSHFFYFGRGFLRLRTLSCWRKAKISRLRWYREQIKAPTKVRSPDTKRIMSLDLYHRRAPLGCL